MNPPRINNDDRGITVNKMGALVGLGTFVLTCIGATVAVVGAFNSVQSGVQFLTQRLDAQVESARDIDVRIRALEANRAGASEQIDALRRDLAEIKQEQRNTNAEIRELLATLNRSIGGRTP